MYYIEAIKNKVILLSISILASLSVQGQTQKVEGRIVDDTDEPLIGATVIVKGTEATGIVGTITDIDGNFIIHLPADNDSLLISYTGYLDKVVDARSTDFLNVILSSSFEQLEQVVVTAMGIRREEKALGYSVEQISGESLENNAKTNPMEALAGKVAGLTVSSSASGPGGSTKVLIRGVSAITSDNTPLYVVDGVPINSGGGSSGTEYGGFDYGNGVNNVNPDDIESIAVLKGGAATALYGYRGSNGVIMITTKSGQKGSGLGVDFSSTVSFDNPLVKPNFQNLYSQGSGGKYDPISHRSWGEKMTGQTVTNFLNENQVLGTASNPYDGFYRTGVTYDNSLIVNKHSDAYSVYFSANLLNSDGIQPGYEYDKRNFNLRVNSKLSDFLKFDAKVNYLNQDAVNRPNLAGSPNNPVYLLASMPRSVQLSQLNPYLTVEGYPVVWTESYRTNTDGSVAMYAGPPTFAKSPLLQNPYWATGHNRNEDERNRLIGFGELTLDFAEWFELPFIFNLSARVGADFISDRRMIYNAHNTYFKLDGLATYSLYTGQFLETNYIALLKIGKTFGRFTAHGTFGGNLMNNSSKSTSASSEAGLINLLGEYVISNFNNPIPTEGLGQRQVQSVFGMASMDWDRKVYLDLTFRGDWSSNLSPENWYYFYPSASISVLLHEYLTLPEFMSFLKARYSYAETGSGGNLSTFRYFGYGTNPNQYFGLPYGSIPSRRAEWNIRPEFQVSNEVGLKAIMFANRLDVDISYYESGIKDQILRSPMAPSSGYNEGFINGGYIKNRGIELVVSYDIINQSNLNWRVGGNLTKQWNNVSELGDGVDSQDIGGAAGIRTVAIVGQPVGTMQGTAFARDEQGRFILNNDNLPTYVTTEDGAADIFQNIGNVYPDLLWGVNSAVSYHGFNLGFLIESKLGADIYSLTNQHGAEYGTLAFTTQGRDEWEEAKATSEITGVPPTDGFMVHGVKDGVEGDYPVDPQKYWDWMGRVSEAFVYDASYIRFRQLSLGYNFSAQTLQNTPFRNLSVSLFANNLFYIMRRVENISPESSFGTGNNVGYELFAQPELRNYGINLKVSF